MDQLIIRCLETKFHRDYGNVYILARIAQGIRADLFEVILKIEKGFYSSCGPLIRSSLENSAALVSLTQKDSYFDDFHSGKFSPSRSISVAKKVFPDLGETYGFWSTFGVRSAWNILGQNLEPLENGGHSLPAMPCHNEFSESFTVRVTNSLLYIQFITYFSLELIFSSKLTNLYQIEKRGNDWISRKDGVITKIMNEHDLKSKEFLSLKKDYAESLIKRRQ